MQLKHIFVAVFVTAIWGFNFIFAKLLVQEMSPFLLCALRFFFAAVPIIFFIPFPRKNIPAIILYGLIMFGLQFVLVFSSLLHGMTAGMASILMQTQIFFSIVLAILFFQERPSAWQILGAVCAFSGIVLVGFHLDKDLTLNGFMLVIGGAIAWGIGNLLSKKVSQVNMIALIAWGSLAACPPLIALAFFLDGSEQIVYQLKHLSIMGAVSLLYIVYASTWLGYGIWNWLLRQYPITSVVPFTLLIPIFGMLGSVVYLHESFEPWKMTAAGLVMTGLCINLIMPKIMLRLKHQRKECLLDQ